MANVDIYVIIIAREKLFHPCKICRAPYGARLISNNGYRPMLLYTDAGLPYVTTQENIIKNRPVPRRL